MLIAGKRESLPIFRGTPPAFLLEARQWIFVSHASADLEAARMVRNHLEAKGASPLLFSLKSLTRAREFWPLIEKEIAARTFFVYCESEAAQKSEWVIRERAAVARLSKRHPKRIAHIRVDCGELDYPALDRFLTRTRVLIAFDKHDTDAVRPFSDVLGALGFRVVLSIISDDPIADADLTSQLGKAAAEGPIVGFVGNRPSHNFEKWFNCARSVGTDTNGTRIVTLSRPTSARFSNYIDAANVLDAWKMPRRAPYILARELLS